MGSWTVIHRDQFGVPIDEFRPINLGFDMVRNEAGNVSYELSLGDPYLSRDAFAPWRTTWYLYRGGNILDSGIHTSRNLNEERDTVLVGGKTWLEYLDHRIYPFRPEDYIKDNWRKWPKQWPSNILTLSDQTEGFDYVIIPTELEFRMYGPPNRRDRCIPVYTFRPNRSSD